jgi:hypothetical protein
MLIALGSNGTSKLQPPFYELVLTPLKICLWISSETFKLTPGVDVMIVIFCDFWQFFGVKIGVFLKNQCCDKKFAYLFWVKNAIFSPNFLTKIF